MPVVVGLGNPGPRYANTRHNVGFAVVREIGRRWHTELRRTHEAACSGRASFAAMDVLLVEPQWLMNRSGEALAAMGLQRAEEWIVIHDDVDLPCGRLRVKVGGGSGGHRGLDSIIEHFGEGFARVRVGVGRPPAGADTAAYVLSPFDDKEVPVVAETVARAADAVECILSAGPQAAMNAFNAAPATPTC